MQAFIIWQVVFYKDGACQPIHTTDIESQMQVHKEPKKGPLLTKQTLYKCLLFK